MKALLAIFARNEIFANALILIVFIVGGFATFSMVRENFPEFSLNVISISVAYPGAGPQEVESGICRKIEDAVEGLEGIGEITTISRENLGTALIEVKKNYDVKQVLIQVNAAMQAVYPWPKNAEKPVVYELTTKSPVMLLYLSGDLSERRLKQWAEQVKKEIQKLPEVSQVSIFGKRDYEVAVEVSEEKLREFGLDFGVISQAIRRSDLNMAGGTLHTPKEDIRLRTGGREITRAELSRIVVLTTPEGGTVTLGRVADILDDFAEDPTSARIDGTASLLVMVFKSKDEDSLAIAQAVDKFVAQKQPQLPRGLSLKILYDNTQLLRDRINLLIKNGISGLMVVVFLLWIFLNGRLAFWVGMGIPFSFAATMAILWLLGETINMVSLFGLITVLGIVVDDATVVAETIYTRRLEGYPPLAAAITGLNEVVLGVASSSLTTVVTFLPLLFVDGVMGRFIAILPTVVIITLLASLWESTFLLPSHLSHLPDPGDAKKNANAASRRIDNLRNKIGYFLTWFENTVYLRFLSRLIPYRYVVFCFSIALLFITFGFIKGGLIKIQLLGEVDGFVITSSVEFPEGTPADITAGAIERIDSALERLAQKTRTVSGEPLVKHRLSIVGQTLDMTGRQGPHVGSVQAILLDSEKRGVTAADLLTQWEKEIGKIPGVGALTFDSLSGGPSTAAIEVWFEGEDMDQMNGAAEAFASRLETFDGVYQIRSDYHPGKNEISIKLKPEAARLGVTEADLARQVYAGFYGNEVVRFQREDEEVRVMVRYSAEERSSVADFEQMWVSTIDGRKIPLLSVAQIEFKPGVSAITRTNGWRRVAVSAAVNTNRANTGEIYAELKQGYFEELKKRFPEVTITLQGEEKEMKASMGSLIYGFPLGAVAVFVIIAATFRSYAQPLLIMVTIPFGIIGAVFGHYFMGYDLTLMSMFGTVAVSGIVVNDAIVLVEKINEFLAEGMPFFGAVILGASRRFRAVFLTTATTVAGLAPLILETDFQAKFLIPMAISLAAGNLFSTFLVIVQLPCLLVILNDLRIWVFYRRNGYRPTRNEVEPATYRNVQDPPMLPAPPHGKQRLPMP